MGLGLGNRKKKINGRQLGLDILFFSCVRTDIMAEHEQHRLKGICRKVARVKAAKGKTILDAPYPYDDRMNKDDYQDTLHALQIELVKLQRAVQLEGRRVAIIFEGRDAAVAILRSALKS